MQELIENIVVAVVVLAVLARLGRSIFTAFHASQTDPANVCPGTCASCKMCGEERRLSLSNISEGKSLACKTPV